MRIIPNDLLLYAVQIDSPFSGTGFVIEDNNKLYLVTARHVLADETFLYHHEIARVIRLTDVYGDNQILHIDLKEARVILNEKSDVAVIELGQIVNEREGVNWFDIKYSPGIEEVQKNEALCAIVAASEIKLSDGIFVGNDALIIGFPTSIGLKSDPGFDYSLPLFRKGIIANTYPDKGTIILDCPSYAGNSGGPVIQVEFTPEQIVYYVIGVVTRFIPFVRDKNMKPDYIERKDVENSGYSVAETMDRVFELLR